MRLTVLFPPQDWLTTCVSIFLFATTMLETIKPAFTRPVFDHVFLDFWRSPRSAAVGYRLLSGEEAVSRGVQASSLLPGSAAIPPSSSHPSFGYFLEHLLPSCPAMISHQTAPFFPSHPTPPGGFGKLGMATTMMMRRL